MDHHRRNRLIPPAVADPASVNAGTARGLVGVDTGPLVSVATRAGVLSLRDAVAADLDAYLRYWHYSGEATKNLLGIDRRKLGGPTDSRERFLSMIRKPGTYPSDVIFSATLNGHLIGYTNMNRYGADEAYVHLHLYRQALRAVVTAYAPPGSRPAGAGLAAALIGPGLIMYFRLFPLRRLILQTRPANSAINRALDLYGFAVEKKYVMNPAGLAAAGEQCLRYVHREDVPRMLQRSQALSGFARGEGAAPTGGAGGDSRADRPREHMQ